jgi:predicted peptidase
MKRKFAVPLITCICWGVITCQAFSQSSPFSFQQFTNGNGDTLHYRQLLPDYDTLRKYPLLIFLHGAGERGSDNEAQLKWGVMNFAQDANMMKFPAIVIAPQCPLKMQWANFARKAGSKELSLQPQPSKSMELLVGLIRQILKTLPADPNRIYITGLSMGGFGTFDAIERYPDLFAAAVPVCGGGDTTKAASIAQMPLWIFAGAEDAAVDPVNAINMAEALVHAGAHPGLTLYPDVGHFSWLGAYSDPFLMSWLFRQHK